MVRRRKKNIKQNYTSKDLGSRPAKSPVPQKNVKETSIIFPPVAPSGKVIIRRTADELKKKAESKLAEAAKKIPKNRLVLSSNLVKPKYTKEILTNKHLRPKRKRRSGFLTPLRKAFLACPQPHCKRHFFSTELKFERHQKIEHKNKTVDDVGNIDKPQRLGYICDNCFQSFRTVKLLCAHSSGGTFCGHKYSVLEEPARKNRVIPLAEHRFVSMFCNFPSTDKLSHEKHLKMVHRISYARYKCDICQGKSKFFVHYEEYINHWRRHKCAKSNPWACMDCGKTFNSYSDYRGHLLDPLEMDFSAEVKRERQIGVRYCSARRHGKVIEHSKTVSQEHIYFHPTRDINGPKKYTINKNIPKHVPLNKISPAFNQPKFNVTSSTISITIKSFIILIGPPRASYPDDIKEKIYLKRSDKKDAYKTEKPHQTRSTRGNKTEHSKHSTNTAKPKRKTKQ